jgi:hypothetical protein
VVIILFPRVGHQQKFSCRVETVQCTAHAPDGRQCRRKVCIGSPYCYVHLLHQKHLRVKKSTLQNGGNGLFATNPKELANAIIFKKGEPIIGYGGELLDDEELDERNGEDNTAPYAVNTKEDTNRDCACERSAGSSANTSAGHNNAKFAVNRTRTEAKLVASKNIKNGEEIFLVYGRSFRLNEPNTSHSTKYRRKAPGPDVPDA